jgi:glycosyltransferase 2 family protein
LTDPVDDSYRSWRRWARWFLLVGGFTGLVLVTRQALSDQDRTATPSVPALVGALVLYLLAGAGTARGWSVLLRGRVDPAEARGAMYESQLAKYVPGGGVLQAAGQVALSTGRDLTAGAATIAWAVSILLTLGSGAVLATPLSLSSDLSTWIRVVALIGFAGILVERRTGSAWALERARRFVRRIPPATAIPPQPDIRRAFLWIGGGFALNAASFAVLAVDLDPDLSYLSVAPAYVAGWLVGFLLVPLPAGLGAREAVLLALLPAGDTGLLLAASVAQRLVVAASEVLLVSGNRLSRRRAAHAGPPR